MEDLVIGTDGAGESHAATIGIQGGGKSDDDKNDNHSGISREKVLEARIKALEAEKLHLTNLAFQSHPLPDSHDKGIGQDAESHRAISGRLPGSTMSLSTGSEESALEEEKFVKIKPLEMDSGSSKASSQSGKENLELEEHIQSLNEQMEVLRKTVNDKEEECKGIKHQLEAVLLEKNVESTSISSLSSDLKSINISLVAKDEQLDEINLVLDDVLEQLKPYLLRDDGEMESLEGKFTLLKSLPGQFKSLESDGEGLAQALSLAQGELNELQDQQSEIIGGYQLVTENYEKLQAEFEAYKRENESSQLKEEFERFREELLSKDEDLMEIQARCDEFEGVLAKKTKDYDIIVQDFVEYKSRSETSLVKAQHQMKSCEELLVEKSRELKTVKERLSGEVSEAKQMCQSLQQRFEESQTAKHILNEQVGQLETRCDEYEKQVNEKTMDLASYEIQFDSFRSKAETSLAEIRKLESRCDQYQQELNEKSLQAEPRPRPETAPSPSSPRPDVDYADASRVPTVPNCFYEELGHSDHDHPQVQQECESAMARTSGLLIKIESLEKELEQKNEAFQDLQMELDEIKSCVELKTSQINDTIHSKDMEFQRLMSAYQSYADTKEKTESDLTSCINYKTDIINRLEAELEGMLHGREAMIQANKEIIDALAHEQLETTQTHATEIEQWKLEQESNQSKLATSEIYLRDMGDFMKVKDQRMAELLEANDLFAQQVESLKTELHIRSSEVTMIRNELVSQLTAKDQRIGELVQVDDARSQNFNELKSSVETQQKAKDGKISELTAANEASSCELSELRITTTNLVSAVELHVTEVNNFKAQLSAADVRAEAQQRECEYLRAEHLRLAALWQSTKNTVREEYVNKLKEEELLRESDLLLLQQQIKANGQVVAKLEASLKSAKAEVATLSEEKAVLSNEMASWKADHRELEDQLKDAQSQLKVQTELETNYEQLQEEVDRLRMEVLATEETRRQLQESKLVEEVEAVVKADIGTTAVLDEVLETVQTENLSLRVELTGTGRKMELLQTKITEIEISEMKAFEQSFVLKNWIKRLELENQRLQDEITALLNSATKDPSVHPKVMKIQEELLRLIYVLDERDKRSVQLTVEITRLLEERDELQLKLSSVLKHNVELTLVLGGNLPSKQGPMYDKKDLEQKLAQLEDTNFRMHIDLKRERETRKLVQDELLYSQAARMYRERELKARLSDPAQLPAPASPLTSSSDFRPLFPETLDPLSGSTVSNTLSSKKESLEVVHI